MGRPPKGSKTEQTESTSIDPKEQAEQNAELLAKELFYDQMTLGLVRNATGMYEIREFHYNSNGDVKIGEKATPETDQLLIMKERMYILLVQKNVI